MGVGEQARPAGDLGGYPGGYVSHGECIDTCWRRVRGFVRVYIPLAAEGGSFYA